MNILVWFNIALMSLFYAACAAMELNIQILLSGSVSRLLLLADSIIHYPGSGKYSNHSDQYTTDHKQA